MGAFITYTIKSAVLLTALVGVYTLLFSRLKYASLRRHTLLAIYLVALSLPLLYGIFMPDNSFSSDESGMRAEKLISMASDNVRASDQSPLSFYDIMVTIAAVGIDIILVYHIACMAYMLTYRFRSRRGVIEGVPVRVVKGMKVSPFCFGSTVYVSDKDLEGAGMVIAHEMSHVRHKHYLDLFLGSSVAIVQWWNPAAWMMLRELRQVHEFQADEDVLEEGYDMKEYQYALVGVAVDRRLVPLGNSMGQSRLKNRLRMINRESSSRRSRMLTLLLIPTAILATSLLSAEALAGTLAIINNSDGLAVFRHDSTPPPRNERQEPRATVSNVMPLESARVEPANAERPGEPVRISGVSTGTPGPSKVKAETVEADRETPAEPADESPVFGKGQPIYRVNGQIISDIKNISPIMIKSISVHKDNPDYPNGLIDIELFSPEEAAQRANINQTDSK